MTAMPVVFGKSYRVEGMDSANLQKFCEAAVKAHPSNAGGGHAASWFSVPEVVEETKENQPAKRIERFYYNTFQDSADYIGLVAGINALYPAQNQDPLTDRMRSTALDNLKRSYVASREKIDVLNVGPVSDDQGSGLILTA
jgi:hypothetical protein